MEAGELLSSSFPASQQHALQGKVDELEVQVGELRQRRAEDARANEKVAAIFAAHEQRWFLERKALRRQVQAVVAAARARELKHAEVQEKLRVAEELRERAGKDAADLREAALVELAWARRQVEATFMEQLRIKDEKVEAFRWRVVTMDVEAARLRRRVQELEEENTSLMEQIVAFQAKASDSETSPVKSNPTGELCTPCSPVNPAGEGCTPCSPVKMQDNEFSCAARRSTDQSSCRSEIEEEKEVRTVDPGSAAARTSTTGSSSNARRTVDIHALAVSYKIKRLKQQLAVLEKLAAAAGGDSNGAGGGPRRYQLMISFVSKHVKRYQSLEEKIDDLCTRKEESTRSGGRENGGGEESKRSGGREDGGGGEESEVLGRFLEETFQLQRYVVATGQKLLEMQSRVGATLARGAGGGEDDDGVDTARFMEVVGALLRDVQRGLEVRIARIIGDLEGTLTFHGILQTTFSTELFISGH